MTVSKILNGPQMCFAPVLKVWALLSKFSHSLPPPKQSPTEPVYCFADTERDGRQDHQAHPWGVQPTILGQFPRYSSPYSTCIALRRLQGPYKLNHDPYTAATGQ